MLIQLILIKSYELYMFHWFCSKKQIITISWIIKKGNVVVIVLLAYNHIKQMCEDIIYFLQNANALVCREPLEGVTQKEANSYRNFILNRLVNSGRSVSEKQFSQKCDLPFCSVNIETVNQKQCDQCSRWIHASCNGDTLDCISNVCIICSCVLD